MLRQPYLFGLATSPGWHARRYSDGRDVFASVDTSFAFAQSVPPNACTQLRFRLVGPLEICCENSL
jgi:hypothetical protein